MPVFNVEEYIGQCLESLRCQTYKDLQLIIVDDGSTDNSVLILNEYREKFKDITIIYQVNQGVSAARNLALEYVKGEYTMYVDPDDFLEKDMLELMYEKAKRSNADITICEYYIYYSKNHRRNAALKYQVDDSKTYNSDQIIDMMLRYDLQGQLWNKLFKTDLIKRNNFQFEQGRFIQDVFPVFKIVCKSNNIVFIHKPLYYYRQRVTSTVHKKNHKLTDDYYFAMSSIIRYIQSENMKVKDGSLKIFRAKVLCHFIAHYTNGDSKNNYIKFKGSEYKDLSVRIFDFIFLPNIDIKDKLKLMLWNFGLYSSLKGIKNKFINR